MKVVHIVPFIGEEASGPAYTVPSLCNALYEKGCQTVLITLKPLPLIEFKYKVMGFNRSKFPHYAFGRSHEMYRALLEETKNADIIHNHSLWMAPNIYAGMVSRKNNVKLINTPHGTLTEYALKRSVWKKKIALFLGQKMALDNTNCFHATGNLEVTDIQNYCPKKPIANIVNGIDIPPLKFIKQKEQKKLLFLGRIHPKKGIEDLLHAWNLLKDEYDNWELDIVGLGDATYNNKLLSLINSLQIKRVKILNPVYGEAKNVIYQRADLFVLPSYSENFGMTVAESLANATPVITTNTTFWTDLDKHKCGWCIDVGVESLKKCLQNAFTMTDEQLSLMGINGRKWMQRDFSWDSIADKTIATYQWVLSKKNKPDFIYDD